MRSGNPLLVNGYGMSYIRSRLARPYMDVRSIELTPSVDGVPVKEMNVFNSVWMTFRALDSPQDGHTTAPDKTPVAEA